MDVWERMPPGGAVLAVLLLLLGLCGETQSQISGSQERIGCVVENRTMTCFDIYNTSSKWSDAWNQCKNAGGQLALLRTPEIDGMVGDYMDKITQNFDDNFDVWIGGRELDDSSWKWVNGTPFQAQNTSDTMVLFSNQTNRYETCSQIGTINSSSTLTFHSTQCKNSGPYICQQRNANVTYAATCEIGSFKGVLLGNSCYAASPAAESVTWFEARHSCSKINADLAVFDETSQTDRNAILSLIQKESSTLTYWVGLRKYPWVWVTSFDTAPSQWEEMWYSGWLADVPRSRGRSCLTMEGRNGVSHGWMNIRCDESHPYICQQTTLITTPPPTTTQALLTTDYSFNTSANANETEVTTQRSSGTLQLIERNIANIIIPCVIVAVVLIVIGFSIYCYFSKRRDGYTQQP